MARKQRISSKGTIVRLTHTSKILEGNSLGDPTTRDVVVYLPASYDHPQAAQRRFPVLFDLVGYTGSGPSHVNWRNFDENVPEKLDRLIAAGNMPPCIVVFPDCFTALGGNQYINSSALGSYADYLTRELIAFVDKEFRTYPDREHRGCFGKSSGGYGAIMHGMRYAKYWGAVASHSGDAYFDFVYKAEWPAVLTALSAYAQPPLAEGPLRSSSRLLKGQKRPGHDDGRIRRFLDYCWSTEQLSGSDITVLMMICMAATYDPHPEAPLGFRLPYDLNTGALIPTNWRRWLKHDPIHNVTRYRDNLKSLRGVYIDCGWRDQYHIHFGARQLSAALSQNGVKHRYEEFRGTHSGVDHRMDVSLPFLARALS